MGIGRAAVGQVDETVFRKMEVRAVSWGAFRISSIIKKLSVFYLFNEFSHPEPETTIETRGFVNCWLWISTPGSQGRLPCVAGGVQVFSRPRQSGNV